MCVGLNRLVEGLRQMRTQKSIHHRTRHFHSEQPLYQYRPRRGLRLRRRKGKQRMRVVLTLYIQSVCVVCISVTLVGAVKNNLSCYQCNSTDLEECRKEKYLKDCGNDQAFDTCQTVIRKIRKCRYCIRPLKGNAWWRRKSGLVSAYLQG